MKRELVFQIIVTLLFYVGSFCIEGGTLFAGEQSSNHPLVKPGIDVLIEKQLGLIKGKNIGLITNPTGITCQFKSTIDASLIFFNS